MPPRPRRALIALVGLALALPPGASGQGTPDTTRAPQAPVQARVVAIDTSNEIRPGAAFWRSLLIPGWGQAATGRHLTGALFATWEGVTMMMTFKAHAEVRYMERTGSGSLQAKRQEQQDWIVLWVFNHLFSGAEAYVAAHLQDFPKDLKFGVYPGGAGVSVPIGPIGRR